LVILETKVGTNVITLKIIVSLLQFISLHGQNLF